MKNNITELVFILDRSGSMAGLESDTIGGFNAMIEKQKLQDGGCYVSTVLFDDESEILHDRVKLGDIPKMTDKDYTVRGCTALIDAIGGANIDAVETATRYGISRDRAVNYNADGEGTQILYESVAKAVCNVRASTPLGADWSDEINADYQKRGKKSQK